MTRDSDERRCQQRAADEILNRSYQSRVQADLLERGHQASDARASLRQRLSRQRVTDQEYEAAERIYAREREQALRARECDEYDSIACALSARVCAEARDEKVRGAICENDPGYRALRAKLELARVSHTRDGQRREVQMRRRREEMEARAIEERHEECRRFIVESYRAKAQQAARDRHEEMRLRQEVADQQKRLAVLEQEQNAIRIERFRRELSRQLVERKEMYAAAREQELARLRDEQAREEDRQRVLNEERRKLVLTQILGLGPEAVKYLPKGVLKEEDLDYLQEDDRTAVLGGRTEGRAARGTAAQVRRQILFERTTSRWKTRTVESKTAVLCCGRGEEECSQK
jgi:hypothetical protein